MKGKEKDDILECVKELQSAMFRDEDANTVWRRLTTKYGKRVLDISMQLLDKSIEDINSPVNPIGECINRCMSKVNHKDMKEVGTKSFNVDKFYNLCIEGYKHFMNDDVGRALPIVFIYVESNKKIGVLPINIPKEENRSPMDFLKQIVYQENPDAYCFCGEASMNTIPKNKQKDLKNYKYGDIIDDPSSKDIMIIQGNTKKGDNSINKVFDIVTNEHGTLEFVEMKDYSGNNMESDKLP